MPGSVELTLRKKLREKMPIDSIIEEWQGNLNPDSKPESFANFFEFCFNTGRWQSLFHFLQTFLTEKNPVHWGVFMEICARSKISIPTDVIGIMIKGARKQSQVELLSRCHKFDSSHKEIIDLRSQIISELQSKSSLRRDSLLEKLAFLRTQRMLEEENKLITLLMKAFPGDSEIESAQQEFEDRWARHILSSRGEPIESEAPDLGPPELSEEQEDWVKVFFEELKSQSESKPQFAYLFSVSLYFMELFAEALEILELASEGSARDWFKLELLLLNRRFLDAINFSQQIEGVYAEDPETTFGCMYARARALKGLGQNATAIELLRGIVDIRPDYRSASSLLTSWERMR